MSTKLMIADKITGSRISKLEANLHEMVKVLNVTRIQLSLTMEKNDKLQERLEETCRLYENTLKREYELSTRLAEIEKAEPVAWQLKHPEVNYGKWYEVEMDRYDAAEGKDGFERRRLYAHPVAAPAPYDQQALELCEVCGWKAVIPGEPCLVCERNEKVAAPALEKCWCDEKGIGEPGVTCGDCPRDYGRAVAAPALTEKQEPYAWRNPMNGVVISNDRKKQIGVGRGYPNFSEPLFVAGTAVRGGAK